MIIREASLDIVCGPTSTLPATGQPEIAFAGRSNVGKSSLINALLNRKSLARTSASPGKTQTINFYHVNSSFYLVDLPGYGYTTASPAVRQSWGRMIERYLNRSETLKDVFLLVDIRHDPSKQDVQMYEYLKHFGLDGLVVATKSDKISRNEMQKNLARIRKVLGMNKDDILIPVSALKKTGHEQLLDAMEAVLAAAEGVGAEEPAAEQQSDS